MPSFTERHDNVYLYLPNLIGYARIACTLYSFQVASTSPTLCIFAYFLSFVCDELDGRVARMFNQTSTFGAVLDMVTDRTSTTGLLVILAVAYPKFVVFFIALFSLDIFSHWFQMYSTLLSGSSTHKDITSRSWLVRAYYKSRIFMGFCCVSCEVLYLAMYLLQFKQYTQLTIPNLRFNLPEKLRPLLPVLGDTLNGEDLSFVAVIAFLAMPGVSIKQLCNWVQLKNASSTLVAYDQRKRS